MTKNEANRVRRLRRKLAHVDLMLTVNRRGEWPGEYRYWIVDLYTDFAIFQTDDLDDVADYVAE